MLLNCPPLTIIIKKVGQEVDQASYKARDVGKEIESHEDEINGFPIWDQS
jgi:hypothetical protein